MNLNQAKFSVHTFVLSRPITRSAWHELKDFFYFQAQNSVCGQKMTIPYNYGRKHELHFLKFKDKGIIVYLKWNQEGDGNYGTYFHQLEIRVNPRRLIGDNTYVGVFEFYEHNLHKLNKELKSYMSQLAWNNPACGELETFSLSRIDLCMNFYIDQTEEFINAIRRCLSPKGFEKLLLKNRKVPKDGVYLKSKEMNVQIYNKYRQMVNEGYETRETELETAKNLVRYEIQLFRPRIFRYINEGLLPKDLSGGIEKTFIAMGALAPYLLFKNANKCFGVSPYYTSQDMLTKIVDSQYKRKTRNQMITFQDLIVKYCNADSAIKDFTNQQNDISIKKLAKKFNELGMNIIAVPCNKDNNLQPVLPSVPELVCEAIRNNYDYLDELRQLNAHYNPTIHIPPYFYKI